MFLESMQMNGSMLLAVYLVDTESGNKLAINFNTNMKASVSFTGSGSAVYLAKDVPARDASAIYAQVKNDWVAGRKISQFTYTQ